LILLVETIVWHEKWDHHSQSTIEINDSEIAETSEDIDHASLGNIQNIMFLKF
jgi:hypothetical protein